MMQAQGFSLISHSPKRWAEFVRTRTPILESIVPLDSRGWRKWKAIGDDTLTTHAKWKMNDIGVSGKKELMRADSGLYKVMWERGLLAIAGLKNIRGNWAGMGREELVAYALGFIEEKGITGRKELENADAGLNNALWRRKLLDELGLRSSKEGSRNWAGMGREELVAYALGFIEEKGITGRKELENADKGLYCVLGRKKLMDAVFSDVESSKHADAVDGVLDALDSFGDDK